MVSELSVQFGSVHSLSYVQLLQPHRLQQTRLPCLSPTPGACSNSNPSSRWCIPRISVLSNESALPIRWPKYWSFNISPSNEYSGLIPFRIDWLNLLAVQGLSRIFSNTTVQKHQFFSTQLSLWSNSHIHTWLLEKPQLWLDGPLSAKLCLCFLICCLGGCNLHQVG